MKHFFESQRFKKEQNFNYEKKRFITKTLEILAKKYKVNLTSFSGGWVVKFEKNSLVRFVCGYTFDLNSAAAAQVCENKSYTSQVLSSKNIPNISHHDFFPPSCSWIYSKKDQERQLISLFNKYNKKVVLKPSTGTGGKDIYLIKNQTALLNIFYKLCCHYQAIALSPFYVFEYEYRAIILKGEVQICYKKVRPPKDSNYQRKPLCFLSRVLKTLPYFKEKKSVSWKHNLNMGAEVSLDIPRDLKKEIYEQARKACTALNIQFACVDVAFINGVCTVIEVNRGIMMEKLSKKLPHRKKLFDIYEKAFCLMLELENKNKSNH